MKETASTATGTLTDKPWLVVGLSRTSWFAAKSAGQTPAGVAVPGRKRPMYVRASLLAWAEKLPKFRLAAKAAVTAPV